MRRIAHISDLHFGKTDPAAVEGLVADLNETRPDLIVASGDFTMAARRDEFVAAQTFLSRLTRPWTGVPGNHDISPYHLLQRFTDPFKRYRRFIAAQTEPSFEDGEIGVVGLNTVRTWAPEKDWSQGNIHVRQIEAAEARLASMPAHLFKIVVAHHPFLPPPWDEAARIVGRADLALAMFQRRGVGLVLGGHLHRHYARFAKPSGAGPEEVLADTGQAEAQQGQLLAVQAGSATSTRLRGNEPNAYNSLVIDEGRVRVTVRLWNGATWEDDSSTS